jgi:hypothetical protein
MPEEIGNKEWKKIVVHCTDVYPIGVHGADKGEPGQILSLNGEKSVSFDEVLNGFILKREWNELIETNERRDNKNSNETLQAGQDMKVTI